jgi:aminoacylase
MYKFLVLEEEVGGDQGMRLFVESEQFRKLNIGFALDEGENTV